MYFEPLMVFQDICPYLSTAIVSAPPPTPAIPTQLGVRVMKENNDLGVRVASQGVLGQRAGQTLFSWAPKSLLMVIAAMKLKDACFLEEKL